MSDTFTIECKVAFGRRRHGQIVLQSPSDVVVPEGRLPRISRLMALAVRFELLLKTGVIESYAELADLGQVTPARISQIMNLNLLAPEIQEQLLFLPRKERGRDRIRLADMQPIAIKLDWSRQRREWQRLRQLSG
jgi:hypothetical protein